MNTNKTPNTLEVPPLITSILADKDHSYHMLCDLFMSDANKAYAMLVEHGSVSEILQHGLYNEFHGFRERLGGMASAVCYLGNTLSIPRLYGAFILITDILYEDFENSAVVATSSPDSAVLENAVVETVQGTTIFNSLVICQDCLKVERYTDDKHHGVITCLCGGDFCGCFSCNLHAFKLQSDSYQSILELIPLSFYEDSERVGG